MILVVMIYGKSQFSCVHFNPTKSTKMMETRTTPTNEARTTPTNEARTTPTNEARTTPTNEARTTATNEARTTATNETIVQFGLEVPTFFEKEKKKNCWYYCCGGCCCLFIVFEIVLSLYIFCRIHFHRYQGVQILGSGAFSEVWEALDTKTGQSVAIKMMNKHVSISGHENIHKRFVVETDLQRSAHALSPDFTIEIFETLEDWPVRLRECNFLLEQNWCVVMEKGGPALSETKSSILQPFSAKDRTCAVLIQIGYALSKLGYIIHSDVKAHNIVVGTDDNSNLQLKLIDFGVARGVKPNNTFGWSADGNYEVGGTLVFFPAVHAYMLQHNLSSNIFQELTRFVMNYPGVVDMQSLLLTAIWVYYEAVPTGTSGDQLFYGNQVEFQIGETLPSQRFEDFGVKQQVLNGITEMEMRNFFTDWWFPNTNNGTDIQTYDGAKMKWGKYNDWSRFLKEACYACYQQPVAKIKRPGGL
eukprot:512274_1